MGHSIGELIASLIHYKFGLFLPFSLHKLSVVTLIAGPLPLPLDVLHHEDDDGEGVEGEDEEDVEVSIAVVPSHPPLFLLFQQS